MHLNIQTILILLATIAGTTMIAVYGSIASRRFNFNYGFFILLSIPIYASSGLLMSKYQDSFSFIMVCMGLAGLYDGTVGWRLMKKYKANTGKLDSASLEIPGLWVALSASSFAIFFGYMGIDMFG